ncbi:MAG: class II aldolase/adducin family protein [Treponema sp.]|nr:class II aldolase/adducin family protein [Treponema sp.]
MIDFEKLSSAEKIIAIGKLIYDKGYNAGKDGNISVRLDSNRILITASGALLGFLSEKDLVVVDANGKAIDSNGKKPSSEIVLHTGIYKERNDINAVIHAHAPYCISLSMLDIDTENDIYAVSSGPIPITEIALPSTEESYEKIRPFIKNRSKAILRRHGAVSWGKDLLTAFVKLEETEHFAKSFVNAMAVKNVKPVSEETKQKLFSLWGIGGAK